MFNLMRTNIGFFGAMNVGKSSLMNLITQQNTSIVDNTPGTTADVKVSMMEIHGIGPVKLFDTPGIDENRELGAKKREKAFNTLKQTDIVLIVVNPFQEHTIQAAKELYEEAIKFKKKIIIIHNLRKEELSKVGDYNRILEDAEKKLGVQQGDQCMVVAADLSTKDAFPLITNYLKQMYNPNAQKTVPILPEHVKDGIIFLNIPMDAQTPELRLLRPQQLMQAQALARYVSTFAYRMNLVHARSEDENLRNKERSRFLSLYLLLIELILDYINLLKSKGDLKLLITDSQAMDVVHSWTLDENNQPIIDITTFSIAMINFMSGGKLQKFVEGLNAFKNLKKGDKILICEACNHDRIMDDIGTVQIPNKIKKIHGDDVIIDFAFGREYQTKNLKEYKVILHCGGCMIDRQNMTARLNDLEAFGVPITNYGIVLSWFQSEKALERVLQPWIKNKKN